MTDVCHCLGSCAAVARYKFEPISLIRRDAALADGAGGSCRRSAARRAEGYRQALKTNPTAIKGWGKPQPHRL
jgi:hypothetical protein